MAREDDAGGWAASDSSLLDRKIAYIHCHGVQHCVNAMNLSFLYIFLISSLLTFMTKISAAIYAKGQISIKNRVNCIVLKYCSHIQFNTFIYFC